MTSVRLVVVRFVAASLFLCPPILGRVATASAKGLKVVVFDIEPSDRAKTLDIGDKLKGYSDLFRKLLADRGLDVIDTTPQKKKIEDNLPLSECNGCDQDIAKALGADIEIATAVHPASAIAFSLSGTVKDVKTDRVLRSGVVDIQGSGDDYWRHGIKFLLKERFLNPPLPNDEAALHKAVQALPKPKN